jgi:hypothetical protein
MVARLGFILLFLVGCTTNTVNMKDVYIDNSAPNNFIGNPCKFYVTFKSEDVCLSMKPKARNPDNPYIK